jgi:hypothetical protein
MNVFLQGMRRSGTTVFFDIFLSDGRFACFYEPLARMHRPSIGGGSGLRNVDLFASARSRRNDFMRRWKVTERDMNAGAPLNPETEFTTELPVHAEAFLKELVSAEGPVVIKFTRMAARLPILFGLDSNATLLHLVREPRSVVTSHLAGHERKRGFAAGDDFFGFAERGKNWSSYYLADSLLDDAEREQLGALSDVERCLLVWRESFRRTHQDGRALFGDRYRLLRQEDFVANPRRCVEEIFELLSLPPRQGTLDWAAASVRKSEPAFAPEDARWKEAATRLGMGAELEAAGYQFVE